MINHQQLANDAARAAHEQNFDRHFGTYAVEGEAGLLVYFNNNPYKEPERRRFETARVKHHVAAAGAAVLATGKYPANGYSEATLIAKPDGSPFSNDEAAAIDDAVMHAVEEAILTAVSR